MPALLLAVLVAFPGERVAGLPTGIVLEPRRWQITIQHRFFNAVLDPDWTADPLRALAVSSSHIGVDRGLGPGLSVGAALNVGDRLLALHAAWRPHRLLTFYPELTAALYQPGTDRLWLNLAAGVPVTVRDRVHVFPFLRATGGTTGLACSFGHGIKYALGDYRAGLEFEPTFLIADSGRVRFRSGLDSLPWTLSFEREAGWHNFVLTLGTAYHSLPPHLQRQDVLDITRGRFRLGFNILRRL
jgi:hypothetical protein